MDTKECECCLNRFDPSELNLAKARHSEDCIDDRFCVECIAHINGYDIEEVA